MSTPRDPARNLLAETERHPNPLKIAIIGAGIDGLAAALALRREGHHIEVYPQPDDDQESQREALVNLGPNATGILRHWGLRVETLGGGEMRNSVELNAAGATAGLHDFSNLHRQWAHSWHLVPRSRLCEGLKEAATAAHGIGTPAVLHAPIKIISVDGQKGSFVLADGATMSADVVVGADGIHSPTRDAATGDEKVKPFSVGKMAIKFSIPRHVALDDPSARPLLDRHCTHATWRGGDRTVDMYDLGENEVLYFVLECPETVFSASARGQGVAQAMEDAAALATVLPAGIPPDLVPGHLALYEKIRRSRTRRLREAQRDDDSYHNADTYKSFVFDELDNSAAAFREWIWSQRPAVYRRMPVAFGPCPGPRQDGFGRPHGGHGERTFTKASIMFKTSRPYLQSLLPPTPSGSFRFRPRSTTFTFASIFITTVGNMSWLGGGGYTHAGLYLHDVEYVKQDGTIVYGTYLPVMFENLADPILSGREELGMNKVYCEIDVEENQDSYSARFSWRGTEFFHAQVDEMSPEQPLITEGVPADAVAEDYGLLTYKYVPATGEPGKADVEYACVIPHAEEAKVARQTVQSMLWAHRLPRVRFEARDWKSLPTLHHVSSALAAMPIYAFVFAKVEKGLGVADMASCRRIE